MAQFLEPSAEGLDFTWNILSLISQRWQLILVLSQILASRLFEWKISIAGCSIFWIRRKQEFVLKFAYNRLSVSFYLHMLCTKKHSHRDSCCDLGTSSLQKLDPARSKLRCCGAERGRKNLLERRATSVPDRNWRLPDDDALAALICHLSLSLSLSVCVCETHPLAFVLPCRDKLPSIRALLHTHLFECSTPFLRCPHTHTHTLSQSHTLAHTLAHAHVPRLFLPTSTVTLESKCTPVTIAEKIVRNWEN